MSTVNALTTLPHRLVAYSARFHHRPVRFFLVGLVGFVVSTTVLFVLVRKIGLSVSIGGACAAIVSTSNNFLLNDAFTWRDRRSPSLRMKVIRFGRYYATTAVGNVVYWVTLKLLTRLLHLEMLGGTATGHNQPNALGYQLFLANTVAIGIGGTINYLLHNRWTWRHG